MAYLADPKAATVNYDSGPRLTGQAEIIGRSAVAVTHTGNLNETTLATVTIPGGAMGKNGLVRITAMWTFINSANNKVTRIRFGGQSLSGLTHTTTSLYREMKDIANRNAENSQIGTPAAIGGGGFGTSTAAKVETTVDTSAAVNITFTATLTLDTESITLESYLVELIR